MVDYVSLIRNARVECFTVYRLSQAKDDKEAIAGWKRDLDRILQIFDVHPVGFP